MVKLEIMDHELKILPQHFEPLSTGEKTNDLREDDWMYEAGDRIKFREWDGSEYTGRYVVRVVTYIYRGTGLYGLANGSCIMSLGPVKKVDSKTYWQNIFSKYRRK